MAEQKAKTKGYWDIFYSALPFDTEVKRCATEDKLCINRGNASLSSDLEWIVPNSPELIDTILNLFPLSMSAEDAKPNRISVLEIGCGVSQLSLSLIQRLLLRNKDRADHDQRQAYDFVSTDVSSVCIEQNQRRDHASIASLRATDGSLSYELLDVLNQKPSSRKFDVILDKGTLDTFLFRSKRVKKGSSSHPPLLTPLLNNIHRWLRSGCEAKYIIISPRQKIKSVRDFRGFASVRRIKFDASSLGDDMVLVKGNSKKAVPSKSEVHVYECIKNESYNPRKDMPYVSLECSTEDESTCANCGMSFKVFRGKSEIHYQGEVVWARRWKNHCVHCK